MADLNDLLKGREQTEATAWLTVKWWAGTEKQGQPIDSGDGKPFRILVRNGYCKALREAEKTFQLTRRVRVAIETTNGSDPQDSALKASDEFLDFERRQVEMLLVRDWENLSDNGEVKACTPVNVQWLFNEFPEIYDQVFNFAHDGRNYGMGQNGHVAGDPIGAIEKTSWNGPDGDSAADSVIETETASTTSPS